jgi:hypothetical protein
VKKEAINMSRLILHSHRFFLIVFCFCFIPAAVKAQDGGENILTGVKLSKRLNLGVDSSKQQRKWISQNKAEGHFVLSFPAGQDWAAVFITIGSANSRKEDREFKDYSAFKTLCVEMKGLAGGERIEVGIKSKDREDDGTGARIPVILTQEWKTYQFSLDRFKDINLKELYVVAELVYTCQKAQTIHLRNIKYLREESTRPETGVSPCEPSQGGAFDIMVGTKLTGDFRLGLNSSEEKKGWLSKEENGEFMTISFPADQDWAGIFITTGPPNQRLRDGRRSVDLSAYNFLAIDMKGAVGKEEVEVGIKTNTQEDDGTETKIPVILTSEWKTYQLPLDRFTGTALGRLYVVAELVYTGSKPQTVFFRNVRYLKTAIKENSK